MRGLVDPMGCSRRPQAWGRRPHRMQSPTPSMGSLTSNLRSGRIVGSVSTRVMGWWALAIQRDAAVAAAGTDAGTPSVSRTCLLQDGSSNCCRRLGPRSGHAEPVLARRTGGAVAGRTMPSPARGVADRRGRCAGAGERGGHGLESEIEIEQSNRSHGQGLARGLEAQVPRRAVAEKQGHDSSLYFGYLL